MKNLRKVSIFLLIVLLINLFLPFNLVRADDPPQVYTDNTDISGATAANDVSVSGPGSGALNENSILSTAKSEGAKTTFRNLPVLNDRLKDLWSLVRWVISFLCVFGTISSFFILTKSFLQLAWIPDHPMQRRKTYVDILTSGVCTILFGGLSLIMTVFYKSFEEIITSQALYNRDYKSAFALFLVEYKYMIAGADAVMAVTLIVLLIKDILELAMSGGNPRKREEAVRSILFTILGIVGCGAVGLIIGIFTGMLS